MSNWKSKILRFGKYTWSEITAMVADGYIPIANAGELNQIKTTANLTFGLGTIWEGTYLGGRDKKYVQVRNIDLLNYINQNGSFFQPISNVTNNSDGFSGIYDGNNQTIANLYMKYSWLHIALFGQLYNCQLRNIKILNSYIEQTDASRLNATLYTNSVGSTIENIEIVNAVCKGYYNSSGLGNLTTNTTVRNIKINNLSLYPSILNAKHSGGIISELSNSVLELSSVNGILIFPDSTYRYYRTGGLVGRNLAGSIIRNCSSDMYIEASGNTDVGVGGLVGQNYGQIINCWSKGAIIRKPGYTVPIGGLVGRNETGGVVTNSYYDKDTSGMSDTGKGLPRTTQQMKEGVQDSIVSGEAIYTGWSNNIWNFRTNLKYPKIRKI